MRCKEVIANILTEHVKYYRSYVKAELIKRGTIKRFWSDLKPTEEAIAELMKNYELVIKTHKEISDKIPECVIANKWKQLAKSTLAAIEFLDGEYVQLTTPDEICLLSVWETAKKDKTKDKPKKD